MLKRYFIRFRESIYRENIFLKRDSPLAQRNIDLYHDFRKFMGFPPSRK